MQVMKRFILITLCTLILLTNVTPLFAQAQERGEQYAVAAQETVYFYARAEEASGTFILPYTYYVKIIAKGEPYSKVEYLTDDPPYRKVTGYCKTDELTFVDFTPVRPYLYKQITVTYSLQPTAVHAASEGFLDEIQIDYLFYGTYTVGSALYYYVYANDTFGYVPATGELSYDLNTDYLKPTVSTPPNGDQPTEATPSLSGAQVFFLCALCAAAVAVAVFVIRGKKSTPLCEGDEEDF